ncbi:tetratricopeptide repeat protein [Desulfovibrio inopinatus]|uniref:tetratricopeptide repeat protein n=1 Tax=Desulfovibrio inopinatus TaxID=102109 RepID=UPI00040228CE|nr:tetratricopeptide repeat protein [Desulfovibrio inopinatus]
MSSKFCRLLCCIVFVIGIIGVFPAISRAANIMDTLFYGVVARQNGDIARARIAFSEVAERDPKNAYAWLQLGILNAIAGNTPDALRFFDHADAAGGKQLAALWKVMTLFRNHEERAAEAELESLLQETPQNALADYLMGLLACHQGQPLEALEYFEKAQSRNAPGAEIHYLLGRAFESMNMPVNARMEYETALEYEPTHAQVLLGLSRVFTQTGEKTLAKRTLEQLLAADPKSPEAATLLSREESDSAFAAWSNHDLPTALRLWRKALEYDRQNEAALYYLRHIKTGTSLIKPSTPTPQSATSTQ